MDLSSSHWHYAHKWSNCSENVTRRVLNYGRKRSNCSKNVIGRFMFWRIWFSSCNKHSISVTLRSQGLNLKSLLTSLQRCSNVTHGKLSWRNKPSAVATTPSATTSITITTTTTTTTVIRAPNDGHKTRWSSCDRTLGPAKATCSFDVHFKQHRSMKAESCAGLIVNSTPNSASQYEL
jgi:hypothetical protein